MAFDPKSLIAPGIGLLGSYLQSRTNNQQSDRQNALQEAELQRRNQIQGVMSPMLARWMGMRNPQHIAQLQQAAYGNTPVAGGGGGAAPSGPSGLSTGLGVASTGLGIAGAIPAVRNAVAGAGGTGVLGGLGLGAATLPVIGGGLALGAIASQAIGRGRRAADQATGPQGYEGQFRSILERGAANGIDPAELQQAYQQYQQATQAAIAAGGKNALVAKQSLANGPLQQTYQRLLQQVSGG